MGDDDAKDSKPEEGVPNFAGLTGPQRALAGVVGTIGVGAGGTAVFISSNQAGSTTLLLVSAVFLLIAVQGTPIRRASKDGALELVGHKVRKHLDDTLEKEGPEAAGKLLEGYSEAVPSLRGSPEVMRAAMSIVNAREWQWRLGKALARVLDLTKFDLIAEVAGDKGTIEITKRSRPEAPVLYVEARYLRDSSSEALSETLHDTVRDTLVRLERAYERRAGGLTAPVLTVTNVDTSDEKMEFFDGLCTWRDDRDDPALEQEIKRILSRAEGSAT